MEKLKMYLKDFIYPFFLIILFGFFLALMIYFITYGLTGYDVLDESNNEKRLDGVMKILGLSISITGFVSIIITIIQSKQSLQRDIQQNSIDLFKELRNEKFIEARRRAWIVKEKWYGEKDYKQKLIEYNFSIRNNVIN